MSYVLTKDDIISRLDIGHLFEAEQNEIIRRLGDVIEKKVTVKLSKAFGDEKIPEGATSAETLALLRKKIPDIDDIVHNIAIDTIEDFVRRTSQNM